MFRYQDPPNLKKGEMIGQIVLGEVKWHIQLYDGGSYEESSPGNPADLNICGPPLGAGPHIEAGSGPLPGFLFQHPG